MGLRVASFRLRTEGPLPANAGFVTETYQHVETTVVCAGREIPTVTVWSGRLTSDPAASSYSLLRPTMGDWPVGTLDITARQAWIDMTGKVVPRPDQPSLAECALAVVPASDGAPPTCEFVSAVCAIGFASHPGGGSRPPTRGIAFAGINDPYGPLVSIDIEYTLAGDPRSWRAHDIAESRGGRAAVVLHESVHEVTRVRITNVLGNSLELLPPFPRGNPPAGPLGMKF